MFPLLVSVVMCGVGMEDGGGPPTAVSSPSSLGGLCSQKGPGAGQMHIECSFPRSEFLMIFLLIITIAHVSGALTVNWSPSWFYHIKSSQEISEISTHVISP